MEFAYEVVTKGFYFKTKRKVCTIKLFKNVWCVRYWLKFGCEIPIISDDEIPLRWNESASQTTSSFTRETTFFKENYMLSQVTISIFTQVFSDKSNPLPLPKFMFEGRVCESN